MKVETLPPTIICGNKDYCRIALEVISINTRKYMNKRYWYLELFILYMELKKKNGRYKIIFFGTTDLGYKRVEERKLPSRIRSNTLIRHYLGEKVEPTIRDYYELREYILR